MSADEAVLPQAADTVPGPWVWLGRPGIAGLVVFGDAIAARRWLEQDRHTRRIWLCELASVQEYVLEQPQPPRLVPKPPG